jgi:hypothetical protein
VIGIIVGSLSNSLTARRKIMDKQGEFTKNGTPLFDGKYHSFSSIRMRAFFQEHGFDVWKVVIYGYTAIASPIIDNVWKKFSEYISKVINVILSGQTGSSFFNVMHFDSVNKIWDKLKNVYEGDAKVNGDTASYL